MYYMSPELFTSYCVLPLQIPVLLVPVASRLPSYVDPPLALRIYNDILEVTVFPAIYQSILVFTVVPREHAR